MEYSDTKKNIRNGIKVFLIDVLNCKYKYYSEYWLVEGIGSMTNNGFGWVSKGYNLEMDETILKILNIIK